MKGFSGAFQLCLDCTVDPVQVFFYLHVFQCYVHYLIYVGPSSSRDPCEDSLHLLAVHTRCQYLEYPYISIYS